MFFVCLKKLFHVFHMNSPYASIRYCSHKRIKSKVVVITFYIR